MRAILEFTLPEEKLEYEMYCNAGKMLSALCDIQEYFRKEWKYNGDAYTEEQMTTLEAIRDRFHEILKENEVSL